MSFNSSTTGSDDTSRPAKVDDRERVRQTTPVLVITHVSNASRAGPSTSLRASASLLFERGISLTFAHSRRLQDVLKILRTRRIVFDSVAALRHGFGAVWYVLAVVTGKQRALYWHETEWAIDAAVAAPTGLQLRRRFKTWAVRSMMRDRRITHFHVCAYGADMLRSRYQVRSPNIYVLNNCCDSDGVLAYQVPNVYRPGLFVGVGRAQERKGTDIFLEIAAKVVAVQPDAQFVWVGELPDGAFSRDALTQRIARLGLDDSVNLTGFRSDRFDIMAEAEAVLLTSRDDPLPKVLQEALALGRPAVAFDVGGVADIVHPYDKLVPFEETDRFAETLINREGLRLDDNAQRERRARFLHYFTYQAFATRFMVVFRAWEEEQLA